ncbi:MAG: hypothetical protein JO293_00345 [Candidatus Eremiobacteraeota bacterium]|nr:hypothetical protein [Candidatus Eremiobacteraeota bacterium]
MTGDEATREVKIRSKYSRGSSSSKIAPRITKKKAAHRRHEERFATERKSRYSEEQIANALHWAKKTLQDLPRSGLPEEK